MYQEFTQCDSNQLLLQRTCKPVDLQILQTFCLSIKISWLAAAFKAICCHLTSLLLDSLSSIWQSASCWNRETVVRYSEGRRGWCEGEARKYRRDPLLPLLQWLILKTAPFWLRKCIRFQFCDLLKSFHILEIDLLLKNCKNCKIKKRYEKVSYNCKFREHSVIKKKTRVLLTQNIQILEFVEWNEQKIYFVGKFWGNFTSGFSPKSYKVEFVKVLIKLMSKHRKAV